MAAGRVLTQVYGNCAAFVRSEMLEGTCEKHSETSHSEALPQKKHEQRQRDPDSRAENGVHDRLFDT
jgi:hypothetical protein